MGMIESMTGFGVARLKASNCDLVCEIKSINSKFFDCKVRLLYSSMILEEFSIKELKKKFNRGKFDLRVLNNQNHEQNFQLNEELLLKVNTAIQNSQSIKDKSFTFGDIRDIPGALITNESKEPSHTQLKKLIVGAITDLKKSRQAEGKKIEKIVRLKIRGISSYLSKLQKIAPKLNIKRLNDMKQKFNIYLQADKAQDIEKELAAILIKHDVKEELDRISFHIDEILNSMKERNSHGKKIDFLLQEIFREANTLTTKLEQSEPKSYALEIKLLTEELREQIQNIQ